MNRTSRTVLSALFVGAMTAVAQEPPGKPPAAPEADPIEGIVAVVRGAEQRARSLTMELVTRGHLPSGLELSTKGTLRVLKGEQPGAPTLLHSAMQYSFADGLEGRMESVQTEQGIWIYEDNPAFGEVYLHVDPKVVADLEWAGTVLARADLPGMADSRAQAPLGSTMLDDMRRQFALRITDRKVREGDAGQWLAGERRPGLGDHDPELPLADRVEVFVRDRDHAVLEVVQHQGTKVLQRITIAKLEVDAALPREAFQVDGRGQRLREVQQYLPMWEQIEQALKQAEGKAGGDVVRPSRRK